MKKIEIISDDRIGLVGEISKIISRAGGDMVAHTANVVSDGAAEISHFTAEVELGTEPDEASLSKKLRRIKNVRQVRITDI